MHQCRLGLVVLMLALLPGAALPDSEVLPYPHVVASPSGRCFFKMTPPSGAPQNSSNGAGYAYKVELGEENTLLWRTSGWYAHTLFLSDDGMFLVRLGNWPQGHEPSPEHLAVAFYKSGELTKSYSTADLIKDTTKVPRSASHYRCLGEPKPALVQSWEKLDFRLTTVDGIEYVFDVKTGEIASTSGP
jgi:hypothetical protein